MKALQDLIGKRIVYIVFTPNGIHNSDMFEGILREVDGHLIAVEREGRTHVINTMSASFERVVIDRNKQERN